MPVNASLVRNAVEVVPGGSASIEMTIRNTGAIVDEFRVEILGPAAEWTTASPSVVPLFPGANATVLLTFSPPRRAAVQAGDIDVVVKSISREDPENSVAEELVLTISPFDEPNAELVPRTARGSRRGKTSVAIDNHGNRLTRRAITAYDSDDLLIISAQPDSVGVEPGRAEFAKLTIKPKKTFYRGQEKTIPYQVALADGESVIKVDGTYVQTPMLPKWLSRLLALVLAGLLALFLMWQFAFKPIIRTAAKEAVKEKPVDQQAKAIGDALEKLGIAAKTPAGGGAADSPPTSEAGAGGAKAPGGAGGGGDAPATAGSGGGSPKGDDGKGGLSKDKRIVVEAAPGAGASSDPWTPAGENERFTLTDVVFQNPQGDSGLLQITRDGEVLLESALENFRDLDFHFVAPYVFSAKAPLVVKIQCRNATDAKPCKAAATFGGFIAAAAPK